MRNQYVQAITNGIGATILSMGWLYHLFGEHRYLIPILIGAGTVLYYLICSGTFFRQRKLVLCVLFGIPALFISTTYSFDAPKIFLLILFSSVLLSYIGIPGKRQALRNVPGVKSIVISACWTFFVLVLPVNIVREDVSLPLYQVLSFLMFFYSLTIPSDIQDLETDPGHLCTIPQWAGKSVAMSLCLILMLCFGTTQWILTGNSNWVLFSVFGTVVIYLSSRCDPRFGSVLTDSLVWILGGFFFL